MNTVGRRIREVRKQRGLTQDKLAHVSGLSKSFISEVENGLRNASSMNLLRVANALGASVEYLLRGLSPTPSATGAAEKDVSIPRQLALAAERLQLSFSETVDLLQTQQSVVARRGASAPKELTVDNWVNLYKAIKKVFG
jgi:transcriptional regulator with XRE-family HTH domain